MYRQAEQLFPCAVIGGGLVCDCVSKSSGVGGTEPIFFLSNNNFLFFWLLVTLFPCYVSCSYLAGVFAARLWWKMPNMNMIQQTDTFTKAEISNGDETKQSFSNPHPWCCLQQKFAHKVSWHVPTTTMCFSSPLHKKEVEGIKLIYVSQVDIILVNSVICFLSFWPRLNC